MSGGPSHVDIRRSPLNKFDGQQVPEEFVKTRVRLHHRQESLMGSLQIREARAVRHGFLEQVRNSRAAWPMTSRSPRHGHRNSTTQRATAAEHRLPPRQPAGLGAWLTYGAPEFGPAGLRRSRRVTSRPMRATRWSVVSAHRASRGDHRGAVTPCRTSRAAYPTQPPQHRRTHSSTAPSPTWAIGRHASRNTSWPFAIERARPHGHRASRPLRWRCGADPAAELCQQLPVARGSSNVACAWCRFSSALGRTRDLIPCRSFVIRWTALRRVDQRYQTARPAR